MNNILREVRQEVGMSVSELARRANTSRQTITNIELHDQEPSGRLMISISEAVKKEPREIFFTSRVTYKLQKSKSTA